MCPVDVCVHATQADVRNGPDHQIHFYTLPALDMVPPNLIKPIRNVVTFAVDEQHLRRPPQFMNEIPVPVEPVEFCVVKRSAIALYSLRERLFYQKVCTSLRLPPHVDLTVSGRKFPSNRGGLPRAAQANTSALPTRSTTT